MVGVEAVLADLVVQIQLLLPIQITQRLSDVVAPVHVPAFVRVGHRSLATRGLPFASDLLGQKVKVLVLRRGE